MNSTPDNGENGGTGRKKRVLIVDDHEDTAEFLCQFLELSGYVARAANDGPAALELAQAFRPDFILMDLGLPVMDGYEVAKRLHALPETSASRLVAFSGSEPKDSDTGDFDEYLVKPVVPARLQAVIERILK